MMSLSKTKILTIRTAVSLVLMLSILVTNAVPAFAALTPQTVNNASATAKYTTDLTQLGRNGRLRENLNFESETSRLVKVLAEGGLRQPVIVDNTGENQDAVVEQVARRIAAGNVPDSLKGISVVKLEVAALYSNAKSDAEVTDLIGTIVNEVSASGKQTVLYVNEIANLLESQAVGEQLLGAITSGKLAIIGGSTRVSYAEKIERSEAFAGVFQAIALEGIIISGQANNTEASVVSGDGYAGDNISSELREMMANDPTGKTRVDVIIQAKDADNAALRSLLKSGEARVTDRIGNTETIVVNLPLSALDSLSKSGLINFISPDRPTTVTGHVEESIGADLVRSQPALNGRAAYNLDGSDIGIAIVDSGIASNHNGYKSSGGTSRLVANVNFTSGTLTATTDGYGHGSHVAGLAAGDSNKQSGAYRGVARNSKIVSVKVLNDLGEGSSSWLLNGLNWILQNRVQYNIKVANLSLGTTAVDSYRNDPICVKVKELVQAGIVVVVAAVVAAGLRAFGLG